MNAKKSGHYTELSCVEIKELTENSCNREEAKEIQSLLYRGCDIISVERRYQWFYLSWITFRKGVNA